MPHTKSAKKSLRRDNIRRLRNRAVNSELRTQLKKVLKACKDGQGEVAKTELKTAFKLLDKCGHRRYVHPNTANRMKSRLAKRVAAVPPAAAPAAS
ncbi:MAG: 30S ribosomal protein S20 [Planctomycetia bacterium]